MAANRSSTAFPRPEEIFSRLEKTPLAPLYLFYGDEAYLIDQAVATIRRRMGCPAAVRSFYAGEDTVDALLETWGAPSLFSQQSLVILRGAELLKAAERERLAAAAELRDATQPLIVCARGRVDVTQKFFALCARKGVVAEFRPPFVNKIAGWAQRFARDRGTNLSPEAAQLLADLVGTDLLALAMEVDKLVAFVFPATDIDAEAVAACVGEFHKYGAFDLAKAIGQRDRQKALELLHRVLGDEREALSVLHALMSHFRRLWQVKDLLDHGAPEGQIERALGFRGERLRALLGQSRLYTTAELRRLWHKAAALDLLLKSARIAPLAHLDMLILEMCTR